MENTWRQTTYRYFCKVYKLSEIEGGNEKEIIKLSLTVAVCGKSKSLKSMQVPVTWVLKQNYRSSAYHLKVSTVLFEPKPIKMGVKNTCTHFFFDWVEKLSLLRGNVKNRKNTIWYKKKTFMFVWLTLMYQTGWNCVYICWANINIILM